SCQAEGHHARNMFAFSRVNPRQFIKFGNLAGDMNKQVRGVETRDSLYARLAGEYCAAEDIFANSIRADSAHSGDDDAWEHRKASGISLQRRNADSSNSSC